jgi:hypothetical protein
MKNDKLLVFPVYHSICLVFGFLIFPNFQKNGIKPTNFC